MSKLLDLMKQLGRDAALADRYDKDPEGVMQEAGLNDEEKQALRTRDLPAIKRLTGLSETNMSITQSNVRAYDDD